MKTKEKIINVFKKLLESSTFGELSRTRETIPICDFEEKCKKRLMFLQDFIPKVKMTQYCTGGKSFFIRLKEFDKEYIHIFPITAKYITFFNEYTARDKRFTFHPKRKKYKELNEIYSGCGLVGQEHWDYGYDSSAWEGIVAFKKTYAISYGQIMRELTFEEYQELSNLYLDKLCELDLKYLESKIGGARESEITDEEFTRRMKSSGKQN